MPPLTVLVTAFINSHKCSGKLWPEVPDAALGTSGNTQLCQEVIAHFTDGKRDSQG